MSRARTLILFYQRHLRVQPVRELMAVAGVAAGVALFFAVQIANSSITGSFEAAIHGVAGHATLEVAARSPEGFGKNIEQQIAKTEGVRIAAPILTQQIVVTGPYGRRPLTLVGADGNLTALGGSLIAQFERYAETAHGGFLVLTQATSDAIDAGAGKPVSVESNGETRHLNVAAVVPSEQLGALAGTPVAAAPLPIVERITGLPNRVSRTLIEPAAGQESRVRVNLTRRFGSTLDVRSIDTEGKLLGDAAHPEAQLTALFSAISLVVGMILAYNALLLASGERRAFIAYLLRLGTPDSLIVASMIFDAAVLGVVGSLIGLLAGDAISLLTYQAPPGYLSAAFPIGSQRVFGATTVLLAFAVGMLAAFAAALPPAISALRSTIEPEGRILTLLRRPNSNATVAFIIGAALVCVSIAASLFLPGLVVVALVALVAGLVICLPASVSRAVDIARRLSRRSKDPAARLATGELLMAPTRSVALVATGAIAVFLMVTIGGAVTDVQNAVRNGAEQTGATADLWIKPGGPENVYGTQPFAYQTAQQALQRLPIVRAVLPYNESFLDLPDRRIWIIGVPSGAMPPIARGQLVEGSSVIASQHLREGGWAALSQTVAREQNLHLGEHFNLPTPSGTARLRLAATISNYGWLPGTALISGRDYSRLWHTDRASQLAITLQSNVPPAQARVAAQQALGPGSSLTIQTTHERQTQVSTVLGSTLSRLNQTSTVVLVAAIATVIAMMLSAIWQRRGRLDALISIGMSTPQLWRLVFYESGCVLLVGCAIGMASGLVGQYLIESWLRHTTGSPVVYAAAWTLGLRTLLIALAISMIASTIALVRTISFGANAAFSTE